MAHWRSVKERVLLPTSATRRAAAIIVCPVVCPAIHAGFTATASVVAAATPAAVPTAARVGLVLCESEATVAFFVGGRGGAASS